MSSYKSKKEGGRQINTCDDVVVNLGLYHHKSNDTSQTGFSFILLNYEKKLFFCFKKCKLCLFREKGVGERICQLRHSVAVDGLGLI